MISVIGYNVKVAEVDSQGLYTQSLAFRHLSLAGKEAYSKQRPLACLICLFHGHAVTSPSSQIFQVDY